MASLSSRTPVDFEQSGPPSWSGGFPQAAHDTMTGDTMNARISATITALWLSVHSFVWSSGPELKRLLWSVLTAIAIGIVQRIGTALLARLSKKRN